MRIDPTKDADFGQSKQWKKEQLQMSFFRQVEGSEKPKSNSLSGNERNRMFIQSETNFDDVSHVSGADFRQDGRGFVLFDFDKDGWIDMGITSPNETGFRILRNKIGEIQPSTNRAVFVKLVGGQTSADPQTQWSSLQPYGARFIATVGEKKRAYQLSCGEGLSSQNSNWIHVSLGDAEQIDRLDITWPSGKKTIETNLKAGSRVVIHERGGVDHDQQN